MNCMQEAKLHYLIMNGLSLCTVLLSNADFFVPDPDKVPVVFTGFFCAFNLHIVLKLIVLVKLTVSIVRMSANGNCVLIVYLR